MSDVDAIALTASAMSRVAEMSSQTDWRRMPVITTPELYPLARQAPPSRRDLKNKQPKVYRPQVAADVAVTSGLLAGVLTAVSAAMLSHGLSGGVDLLLALDAASIGTGVLAWRRRNEGLRRVTPRERQPVEVIDRFPRTWASRYESRFAALPRFLPEIDALRCVTVNAVESIVASASWQSPDFDTFGLRMNLKTELDDVDAQAYRIADALASIGPRPSGSDEISREAAALWDATRARLDPAWDALRERVGALIRYRNQITELDQQLDNLAALRRLDAAASKIEALAVGTAIDEMATVRLNDLAERIEIIRRAIRETIALSDGVR